MEAHPMEAGGHKFENIKRDSRIELLRCVCMFLIVLHHAAIHGLWGNDVSQRVIFFCFSCLTIWHVDCFIGISGWFGIKFKCSKFFRIWGTCAFYTLLSAIWVWTFDREAFTLRHLVVHGGWFAGVYMMLMLMAPLLNGAVEAVCKAGMAWRTWMLFAIGIILGWLPLNGLSGVYSGGDFLIVMTFVYVTARMLRLTNFQLKKKHVVFSVGAFLLLTFVFIGGGLMSAAFHSGQTNLQMVLCGYCYYNSPAVWSMAMMLVLLFAQRVKSLPGWLGRIVVFCSPSLFGVFLFHETTAFGPELYRIPERVLCDSTEMPPALIVFTCAMAVFVVSICVDLARRSFVMMLHKSLGALWADRKI